MVQHKGSEIKQKQGLCTQKQRKTNILFSIFHHQVMSGYFPWAWSWRQTSEPLETLSISFYCVTVRGAGIRNAVLALSTLYHTHHHGQQGAVFSRCREWNIFLAQSWKGVVFPLLKATEWSFSFCWAHSGAGVTMQVPTHSHPWDCCW